MYNNLKIEFASYEFVGCFAVLLASSRALMCVCEMQNVNAINLRFQLNDAKCERFEKSESSPVTVSSYVLVGSFVI